jgi:hypothetical protein
VSFDDLINDVRALATGWAGWTGLGTFIVYGSGYLATRFHVTALGVGTDLQIVDERYLFNGARCLTYLIATVPSVMVLALVLAGPLWLVGRIKGAQRALASVKRFLSLHMTPRRFCLLGSIVAVAVIQFLLRPAFMISDLLLSVPDSSVEWLYRMTIHDDEEARSLLFVGMVAAVSLTVAFRLWSDRATTITTKPGGWRILLNSLIVIELFFLPVNYGALVVDKQVPRVAVVPGKLLEQNDSAWLVWEGDQAKTFFIRRNGVRGTLYTTPRKLDPSIEIAGYDVIATLIDKQAGR